MSPTRRSTGRAHRIHSNRIQARRQARSEGVHAPCAQADLVEYCFGDATTGWGRQRIADGHPHAYNISAFELGNEQYNPDFVAQAAAMEARAQALGAAVPPLRYAFPTNGGLNAADAKAALDAGLDSSRILTDVHVGATGGVAAARDLLSNPPVPGFTGASSESRTRNLLIPRTQQPADHCHFASAAGGVVNLETNAGSHDHQRALDEASDLLEWIGAQADTYDCATAWARHLLIVRPVYRRTPRSLRGCTAALAPSAPAAHPSSTRGRKGCPSSCRT